MKYGFVLPHGDARFAAELAAEAEAAGWDGIFVWEPVWGVDAWVSLTAAAMRTASIRLGTLLSPLSRMRPWKIAGEAATLDNLSGGRVILSVGLGAVDTGFEAFGEETDRRVRAELLDECLDIVTGLWAGQPFAYDGRHYQVRETDFFPPPPPVQQPRIPIWVVGAYPSKKSMGRALRYDGLLPQVLRETEDGRRQAQQASVEDIRAISAMVRSEHPNPAGYDIVVEGETPGDKPDAATVTVAEWAAAGATWWIESRWSAPHTQGGAAAIRERVAQGPPRLS